MKQLIHLFILFFSVWAHAEYRIWTDVQDNVVEAEFVCMDGGMVVLRNHTGEEFKFTPEKLSSEDQRYVESRVPPLLDINVSKAIDNIGKSNKTNSAKQRSTVEYVRCIATIRQSDTRPYNGDLIAHLLVIAEDNKLGGYVVVDREEQKFKLEDANNRSVELTSKSLPFNRSSKRGKKYSGYLVVVNDKYGQVIAIKSNREIFEKMVESLVDGKKKSEF